MAANVVSFVSLSFLMFSLQRPVTFYRFDGTHILSVVRSQAAWMPGGVFATSFLQGNGGLWFPTATQLIPGFAVGQLAGDAWLPVVAFTVSATEFFLATVLLGISIGFSVPSAIAGAWLGALAAFPYIVPTPAMERLWGNPHFLTSIAVGAVTQCLFLRIGRSGPKISILATAAILALASQPARTPLVLGVVAFFCLFATLGSKERHERVTKLVSGGVIAIAFTIAFGPYFLGLFAFAKTTYFWTELLPLQISFRDLSFLLEDPGRRPLGVVVWILALLVAGTVAWAGSGMARMFASGHLALAALLALLATILALRQEAWRGPTLAYIDICAYPLWAILWGAGVVAIVGIAGFGLSGRTTTSFNLLAACATLPWLVLAVWRPPYDVPLYKNYDPFLWPPQRSPVVDFLEREVALFPGKPFRGRVANLAGSSFELQYSYAPFLSQHDYDAMLLFFAANEHRMYGLWYFSIPTLIEHNQFSSPYMHLLTARLLNSPTSLHTRATTSLVEFNRRILAALGVRYVIHDRALDGFEPRLVFEFTPGRRQYVYELERPNVAGVAVETVVVATNAEAAVQKLSDPSVDLRRTAVVFEEVATPLMPVTSSSLRVERGRLRVEAESAGTSLLVLPVEYGHCLVSDLRATGGTPRTLRANLLQVGVLFSGRLEGTLMQRHNALINRTCRLADMSEADRLQLGEAARR